MPYSFYKVLHLISILTVFLSLGAVVHHMITGGTKNTAARKLIGITHGVALFLVFLSGFGLIAKLKLGFPGWIYVKIAIWIFLGGATAILYRKPQLAKNFWFLLIAIAGIASYLGHMKPF